MRGVYRQICVARPLISRASRASFPQGKPWSGAMAKVGKPPGQRLAAAQPLRAGPAFADAAKSSSSARAARSEAERAGVEICRFKSSPRPSVQGCYAGARPFGCRGKAQGRRGCRHLPHRFAGPRPCQTLRRSRKVWHPAPFLLDRARPVFFSARRKENGGCSPPGTSRPPHRPTVKEFTPE